MTKLEELADKLEGALARYGAPMPVRSAVEALAPEVRLALAPRDASPELAEAEKGLRACVLPSDDRLRPKDCAVIAGELDRLRAENRAKDAALAEIVAAIRDGVAKVEYKSKFAINRLAIALDASEKIGQPATRCKEDPHG